MTSGTVNSSLTRGYGTLGGLGIIGAAIFAIPSTLLLEPLPPAEAYLSTLTALFTGLTCLALPWERMNPRWLHLLGVLATVEAAWAVAVFGQVYIAFFFLIAVSVAYVTPNARILAPHLALIGLAMIAPVVYGPVDARSTIQVTLVVYPLLVLTAALFAYLRQRMVADHRSYRLFAEETLALADRIAGYSLTAQRPAPADELDDLPEVLRYRVSARAATAGAAVLALPLVTAGLAVAGVKLPSFAAETFGNVGIELPNQSQADTGADPPSVGHVAGGDGASAGQGGGDGETRSREGDARGERARDRSRSPGEEGADDGATATASASAGATGVSEIPSAPGIPDAVGEIPSIPGSGESGGQGGSLGQTLDDATSGLGGILGGKDGESGEDPPQENFSAE